MVFITPFENEMKKSYFYLEIFFVIIFMISISGSSLWFSNPRGWSSRTSALSYDGY